MIGSFLNFCRFAALLGQFNLQKFVSSVRKNGLVKEPNASWLQGLGRHLQDKSLYALNFCSEMLLTPNDTLLVSVEDSLDKRNPRKKAVFRHKASERVPARLEVFLFLNVGKAKWRFLSLGG